jgi:hypothetical protein
MKNKYFGDINDYRKYGLLRLLTGKGRLKTAVCWMLTPDDGQSDGKFTTYLHNPIIWGQYDSELYDQLREILVVNQVRDVRAAENAWILPSALFYAKLVPDDAHGRTEYFRSFMQKVQDCDLIFFDPDNGIEVKSKPYGRKGSSKYLYWREIIESFSDNHSLLIYQHFPRVERDRFIRKIARQLATKTGARQIYSFKTSYVVFLLACRERHRKFFQDTVQDIEKNWEPQFHIATHTFRK